MGKYAICWKFRTNKNLGKHARCIILGQCNIWQVQNTRKQILLVLVLQKKFEQLLQIYVLDSENEEIEFIDGERK